MRTRFSDLERRLEMLVEGSLDRLTGAGISASLLAGQLAHALEDQAAADDYGRPIAPDEFYVSLHPVDLEALTSRAPDVEALLARGITDAARECGLVPPSRPLVELVADPNLPRRGLTVTARHRSSQVIPTQGMSRSQPDLEPRIPAGAYVIIDGRDHRALTTPVVNIGRRLENQIVLADPRVSRSHAQLQARERRFVLFDLGSSGGTSVNGRRVSSHILHPGDVIQIGDTRLVYGDDASAPSDPTPASSLELKDARGSERDA